MSLETEIRHRIDERRALLMERLDLILAADARGDGATTWLEIELGRDEMSFLHDLYMMLWRSCMADSAL